MQTDNQVANMNKSEDVEAKRKLNRMKADKRREEVAEMKMRKAAFSRRV